METSISGSLRTSTEEGRELYFSLLCGVVAKRVWLLNGAVNGARCWLPYHRYGFPHPKYECPHPMSPSVLFLGWTGLQIFILLSV